MLAAALNKLTIPTVLAAGVLVDQFFYAGKGGAELLRVSGQHQAASYYQASGERMSFSLIKVGQLVGGSNRHFTY